MQGTYPGADGFLTLIGRYKPSKPVDGFQKHQIKPWRLEGQGIFETIRRYNANVDNIGVFF